MATACCCMPGGTKGRVVALDKNTGERSGPTPRSPTARAYSFAIIVDAPGRRQFIALARDTVLGVEVQTGKLLWSHEHESTCDQNVTSPIFHDGRVFVTSGHRAGGRRCTLSPDGRADRELVRHRPGQLPRRRGAAGRLSLRQRLPALQRGCSASSSPPDKTMYNSLEIGKVSITLADGLLYCLGQRLLDVAGGRDTAAGARSSASSCRRGRRSHPPAYRIRSCVADGSTSATLTSRLLTTSATDGEWRLSETGHRRFAPRGAGAWAALARSGLLPACKKWRSRRA